MARPVSTSVSLSQVPDHIAVSVVAGGKLSPARCRRHCQSLTLDHSHHWRSFYHCRLFRHRWPLGEGDTVSVYLWTTLTMEVSCQDALTSITGGNKVEMTLSVSTCGSLSSLKYILPLLPLPSQVQNFRQQDKDDSQSLPVDHCHHGDILSPCSLLITGGKHSVSGWRWHCLSLPQEVSSHTAGGKLSVWKWRWHCLSLEVSLHTGGKFQHQGGDESLPPFRPRHRHVFSRYCLFLHRWITFNNKMKMTPSVSTCGSLLPQRYLLTMLWITLITEVSSGDVLYMSTCGSPSPHRYLLVMPCNLWITLTTQVSSGDVLNMSTCGSPSSHRYLLVTSCICLRVDHPHHTGIFWWRPVYVYLWITLITQVSSGDALYMSTCGSPSSRRYLLVMTWSVYLWITLTTQVSSGDVLYMSTCGSPSSHRYLLVMPCICLPVDHPHHTGIFWWCPVYVYLWITLITQVSSGDALYMSTCGSPPSQRYPLVTSCICLPVDHPHHTGIFWWCPVTCGSPSPQRYLLVMPC